MTHWILINESVYLLMCMYSQKWVGNKKNKYDINDDTLLKKIIILIILIMWYQGVCKNNNNHLLAKNDAFEK